jgi:hypothetical protein
VIGLVSRIFGSGKPSDFLRRRSVLFGCAVLIPLIAASALAGISIFESASGRNSISFTCHSSIDNRTFEIPVEINLADRMDQEEAKRIATEAFGKAVDYGEGSTLKVFRIEANLVNSTWNVGIYTIWLTHVHGPSRDNFEGGTYSHVPSQAVMIDQFLVTIDPNARDIEFFDCLVPTDN